jgi:hypothetical protein
MLRSWSGVAERMLYEHPNAVTIRTSVEVEPTGTRTVLIVETDLELDPLGIGYNKAKVDSLVEAARRHLAISPEHATLIRLVPFRDGRPP